MHYIFQHNEADADAVREFIVSFQKEGRILFAGKRNTIKVFQIGARTINIKSFKIPNLINTIVYRYFRKSKARRSFEFANLLLQKQIGTPKPIAFAENYSWIGLRDSYYVSEQLEADLTFRELVEIPDYPDHENILRRFTKFSFELHQKGVEFLDHSPGNTLIKSKGDGTYEFFLVDLNRMRFHDQMPFEVRMKNLSRLTPKKDMVAVISNEYAKLSGVSETEIFESLWKLTSEFQYRFHRKKRIKKKLRFWK